ncbi:helix-hairpin-helix domain-containing protein [Emticicia sp. BO119]|uniref:helix-hairpin-helix domain-containing protein n=1 Tax=Emticicia sp. BO119 TaxID=2757768 RepID=UPI0015F117D1|nr:helix-hairpin-helix domain-containing protein [Emticicia sp. BO119]MBA4852973.1 helix-hairpin-helix domain-containing protein [Emticicia sp. BO119]
MSKREPFFIVFSVNRLLTLAVLVRRELCLLVVLFLLTYQALAQTRPRPEINLDEFIQRIFPLQQENINYEDLYESLFQLYQNPVDLNVATYEELSALYVLSVSQMRNLLAHRTQFGDLLSIYELQAVSGFDLSTIEQLLPFVEVRQKFNTKTLTNSFSKVTDHYLILRSSQTLEKSKGFIENKYLGSPQQLYARYRLSNSGNFQIGLVAEKDAGEKKYSDFYSFHIQLKNKGNLKNLVIGDYQVQFGQGLVLGSGFFLGKGSEAVTTIRRSNMGIRPYSSLLEGGYFRGLAATYRLKKTDLTTFYSYARRDANIDETDGEREEYFSSILTAGYHRTETEMARKNQLSEQNIGANATFHFNNGYVGATLLHTQFDALLMHQPRLYNKFEFKGKQNTIGSTNFTYTWQNFNFFGEAARSSSGGIGLAGGWVAALTKQIEWAMHLRYYDKNFHSFYGNALAEGSRNINERGVYWGLKYSPKKNLTLSGFYDRFSFPWLKYLVDAPSRGFDYLLRASCQINKKALLYAQYHAEYKGKNLPDNITPTDIVVNTIRNNILGNFDYTVNRTLKIQSRVQINTFQYEERAKSVGYAIMQDVEGSIKKLYLKGRIAWFATDNYDSRIYAFENTVLYAVSFPAYYGKGIRVYLTSRYALNQHLDLWLRYARTQLTNQDSIGSGNDMIDGNHKSDINLQVRYRF